MSDEPLPVDLPACHELILRLHQELADVKRRLIESEALKLPAECEASGSFFVRFTVDERGYPALEEAPGRYVHEK